MQNNHPAPSRHPFSKPGISCLAFALCIVAGCSSQSDQPAQRSSLHKATQQKAIATAERPVATSPASRQAQESTMLHERRIYTDTYDDALISYNELPQLRAPSELSDRERYAHFDDNPVQRVTEQPLSTFSIDVDTGSYANVRRMLLDGQLPPQDAVRVEEMLNYFSYEYPQPRSPAQPFSITTRLATTPWNPNTHLLSVGLQGFAPTTSERPASNLVFLIDVSGSMQDASKLPLLKKSFRLLTNQLTEADTIAMVVYAGGTGIVLEPTSGENKATIMAALDRLDAGGSTNGAAGIELAYSLAEQAYLEDGINRVILATDGDFNVGTTDFEQLIDKVEKRRRQGISLTTLGFGTGNYNDQLMEQLADKGNGNYAYIDNLQEARKVLVEELNATLHTIARDVKIQLEFNPGVVAEYRLIGYENRQLRREDFNNDHVDAGEIGAGHTVTAMYEISLTNGDRQYHEPLRYQQAAVHDAAPRDELAFIRLRYKTSTSATSQLLEHAINQGEPDKADAAMTDLRFAAAIAAFGQRLRGGTYLQGYSFSDIRKLARKNLGEDTGGYRAEFIRLVDLAASLDQEYPDRLAKR